MAKKRILIFINYYGKKSETFISDELAFLSAQENVKLEILHYGQDIPSENVKGLNMPASFTKRFLKNPTLFSIKFLMSLKYRNGQNGSLGYLIDFFRRNTYDTIYCHFGTNGKLIAELKALGVIANQTKLVVRFHGLDMTFSKYPVGFYDILNEQADEIMVGSNFAKDNLSKYGIEHHLIQLNPVGIKQINIATKINNITQDGIFQLISVGRLIELKGYVQALELLHHLRNIGKSNFLYTIIGDGILLSDLRNKIEFYDLQKHVQIINHLPHRKVLDLIKNSNFYLYSGITDYKGRTEAQGLANIEAMANGLPIIASNVGGVADYVLDGITGFLCPEKDKIQFAEKIKWIMENYNSDKIVKIRKSAIKMVRDNYCQEDLNQRLLKILLD